MSISTREMDRSTAEAERRDQALPLLFMLFILFFSPLIFDLAQRLAGL